MATVNIPDQQRTLHDPDEIRKFLLSIGIQYEHWESSASLPQDSSAQQVLNAYADQVERLKSEGGYVTADVIDVRPDTPGLDAMLAKFKTEHWHDEDEVRYIVAGRGLFHIHPTNASVCAIEVEPGDLIRVPRGTLHWFDLCSDRRVRAIRLFQDPSGWTPHYTNSGVEEGYQPLCFGPRYIPVSVATK
jgi:1,2-dihydroxy-3-keto-5-methylthiopentene dioxygenase